MIQSENMPAVLAARHYLYVLFQSLFGTEPSESQLGSIDLAIVGEAFALMAGEDCPDEQALADFEALLARSKTECDALKSEYTSLFIGPSEVPVPPWESVYVANEKILFSKTTLDVRNSYRSQGFIPELYPHVADDHLSLELDFLAKLAMRALEAYSLGSYERFMEAMGASGEFLDKHLTVWLDAFVAVLVKQPAAYFYSQAARMLDVFIKYDAGLVDRLLDRKKPYNEPVSLACDEGEGTSW